MRNKQPKQNKRKMRYGMLILFIVYNLVLAVALAPLTLFYGPFDGLKSVAVASVLTSRHPQVVQAFLSDEKIEEITHKYERSGNGTDVVTESVATDVEGITIEEVKGSGWAGKVMLIDDPKWIQLAVTSKLGVTGERVSTLVQANGAIAGINGGGFDDPDGGRGNGKYPQGIAVHKGKIVHNSMGSEATDMVAFDRDGQMVIGIMTAAEVIKNNIWEGTSFYPPLIKDGKRTNFVDGEWGIAPRTAIGQAVDGTIIFVVVDGRQPLHSLGAQMTDLYNIFLKYGAVNAACLDGGSSVTLVYQGKVINKPCDIMGERYVSDAFVVVPN
ncbi:MAG: phosphodiester glycosidase family protein [Peptococcaceae bacterium]|jgi:exopolysaccharide biosynthesis protein|nr:phosphodiester glycosidase family protein [Peptococcaceae bacterium]